MTLKLPLDEADFIRCWNDRDNFPMARLEARFGRSARSIKDVARALRLDGKAVQPRGNLRAARSAAEAAD